MNKKGYSRLTLRERIIIETLLTENCKKSFIAKRLNRSRSTIGREINKWIQKQSDVYKAELAHWYAVDENNSKRFYDKISLYPKLRYRVYRDLLEDWPPELISGRLKLNYPNNHIMSISYKSFYKYIYTMPRRG